MSETTIPIERIRQAILLVRGQKVMLDRDLAAMQVRNISQFVISSPDLKFSEAWRTTVTRRYHVQTTAS